MTRSRAGALGALLLLVSLLAANAPAALADEGVATWYGEPYHGRRMANGQVFDMNDPTTTASNRFPLGTWVRVTNPANGHTIVVQVRDRGAFSQAFDLSYGAFKALADPGQMRLKVRYEVVSGPDAAAAEAAPTAAATTAEAPPAAPTPEPPDQSAATEPTAVPVAAAAASQAEPIPAGGLYTVRPGETLVSIAQRFGLSAPLLVAWNNLPDPNYLGNGQQISLLAPAAPSAPAPPAPTVAPQAAAPVWDGRFYVVQEGDVLWQIAAKLGISTEALLQVNGLAPTALIVPGQELRLPSVAQYYTVVDGDTLASIAAHFGTSTAALLALNALTDADLLRPGQELRVH